MIHEKTLVDVRINCVTRLIEIDDDEIKDIGLLLDKSEEESCIFKLISFANGAFSVFSAFMLTENERLSFVFRDKFEGSNRRGKNPSIKYAEKIFWLIFY